MSRRPSFARFPVVAVFAVFTLACGDKGAASSAGLLVADGQRDGGSKSWSSAGRRLATAAGLFAARLDPLTAAFAFLPVRTVLVLSVLVDSDLTDHEAGQISRQDTLWFQAGSGEDGMTYLEGSNLAPPKWSGAFPSIAGPLVPPTDQTSADPNRFTFQIGR
ncbi:hypothetical protein [Beijerinckia sp. L45]|uniref:hypothetical protein n=1 Tax=Beijerinckia sp. L45 TaxID=1641855 RepID=UPI00131E6B24|nr:hypothetical protein [Beijerinckia sp. L45]